MEKIYLESWALQCVVSQFTPSKCWCFVAVHFV